MGQRGKNIGHNGSGTHAGNYRSFAKNSSVKNSDNNHYYNWPGGGGRRRRDKMLIRNKVNM